MEEKNEINISEQNHSAKILSIIRSGANDTEIQTQLREFHENDIAGIFDELTAEERNRLPEILGAELMSEIVAYMDDAGEYLSEITPDDAAEIIEQMDADDAAEALDELDEQTRSEIIDLIEDAEIKKDIKLIESYEDDEFGSRMSTNFICVNRKLTIKETMKTMVSEAAENDNIYTIFAVEDDGSFYGAIDLKDLIVARSNVELETLISTNFPFVYDKDVISESIERLRGYASRSFVGSHTGTGPLRSRCSALGMGRGRKDASGARSTPHLLPSIQRESTSPRPTSTSSSMCSGHCASPVSTWPCEPTTMPVWPCPQDPRTQRA